MSYLIGRAAEMLGVSTGSLRKWERHGLIPKPRRRPTSIREYTDDDIEAVKEFLEKKFRISEQ